MNWIATIWRMPDLRSRVLFTIGMLAVFRLGIHIPAPGVDREALASFVQSGGSQGYFGLYDMMSGGALLNYSVFALGVMPYITSSIVVQILTVAVPALERLSKEGQQGRGRVTQYTRYLTIVVALVQSAFIAVGMQTQPATNGMSLVIEPGWQFVALTMATMTAGSCFVMWIGEQISERGIGNGSSLIIMSGIIARFPQAIFVTAQRVVDGEMNLLAGSLLLIIVLVSTGLIVWVERAQRRLPIQYAKRIVGRRGHGAQSSHLPLRLNNAGVIPPIFASSVLMAPGFLLQNTDNAFALALATSLAPGAWLYDFAYIGLIVFFAYFYTAMIFNPMDVADNLKRHGANIPGIRPGKQTAEYIDYILTRLTAAGSVYLAAVCILPTILITQYNVPFYFGGTSLLIVVGVSLDLVNQIEAQMLTRHYDGISSPQGAGPSTGRRKLLLDAAQGGV